MTYLKARPKPKAFTMFENSSMAFKVYNQYAK